MDVAWHALACVGMRWHGWIFAKCLFCKLPTDGLPIGRSRAFEFTLNRKRWGKSDQCLFPKLSVTDNHPWNSTQIGPSLHKSGNRVYTNFLVCFLFRVWMLDSSLERNHFSRFWLETQSFGLGMALKVCSRCMG